MSVSSDYERIERAIEYLDRHAREQPSLERVAKSSGLSPSHFQRVFTRWAGVSPKRFLQFQTVAHGAYPRLGVELTTSFRVLCTKPLWHQNLDFPP